MIFWLLASIGTAGASSAVEPPNATQPLAVPAPEVGLFLTEPPPLLPGGLGHVPTGTLEEGIAAWQAGDPLKARKALEIWLDHNTGPWGRERTAGRFLLGWIYFQAGDHNLASAEFTRVRLHRESPLAPYGAWYEALSDHRRGRHAVAAAECATYREKYEAGVHREDCLLLMGDAYSAAGRRTQAITAYSTWLEEHPDHPRREEASLGIALAEIHGRPQVAATKLQQLLLDHSWATTGSAAQAALAALADQGTLPPELDPMESELRRARTLKTCGDRTEAWEAYCHIRDGHSDSARARDWSRANGDSFAHKTRHFEVLAAKYESAYRKKATAETAWKAFRYHFRAGNFRAAGEWGELGLDKHPSSSRFKSNRDQIAQAWQLAGNYDKATLHWDAAARRGGQAGRLASFYAAFTRWRDKDWASALARLNGVVEQAGDTLVEALYYRGRTQASLKKWPEHRQDFDAVLEEDSRGWYSTLVGALRRSWAQEPPPEGLLRIGRWPGLLLQGPPRAPWATATARLSPSSLSPGKPFRPDREVAWDALAWPLQSSGDSPPLPAAPTPLQVQPRAVSIPASAPPGRWHEPAAARSAFVDLVDQGAVLWPELPAMLDLADVGLFDLTAPYMASVYAEWKKADRRRIWGTRGEKLRAVDLDNAAWRQVFLHAQDPYGLALKAGGLGRHASTPEEAIEAKRQGWPTAYRSHVERWSRTYDVDPMLIWGLMRQESLYRSHALSSVGAVGVMQVMPGTGARIASDLGDWGYTPARLEIPSTNVRYGTWYLSQLMDRFDGVWPIAVAGYNAGPVNASAWLQPQGSRIGIDSWVEQIPLSETRNYVKRVGGNYATYLALYADPGTLLDLPLAPAGDASEVIDY